MAKVLLVDDDALARGYIRTLLQAAGHGVVEAADGREAVRAFDRDRFDLVVMDIYMPRMSGYEALIEMDPAARDVPVIALSGGGVGVDVDPLDLAKHAGACSTIRKPFRVEEFLDVLARHVPAATAPAAVRIA